MTHDLKKPRSYELLQCKRLSRACNRNRKTRYGPETIKYVSSNDDYY